MEDEWPNTDRQPAISYSKASMYSRCRRKWMLSSLWRHVPTEISYDVMAQKALLPASMLAGTIVDTVIKISIRTYISRGHWRTDLHDDARRAYEHFVKYSEKFSACVKARDDWKKIDRKSWARPIDMIHFDGEVSQSHLNTMWPLVDRSLTNFSDFVIAEELADADATQWKLSDGKVTPWFLTSKKVPVFAAFDFVVPQNSSIRIIDWKTGRSEGGEYSVREQLRWYAAYAASKWGHAPETMELHAVWLSEDNKITTTKATRDDIDAMEQRWSDLYDEQWGVISRITDYPDELDDVLPFSDNLNQCLWCQFRSCEGRTRLKDYQHDTIVQMQVLGPGDEFGD